MSRSLLKNLHFRSNRPPCRWVLICSGVVAAIPSAQVRNAAFEWRARQARVGSPAVTDVALCVAGPVRPLACALTLELSFVACEPGAATLLETETKKLDPLAQATEKRPALNLEIEGARDPKADRDAPAPAFAEWIATMDSLFPPIFPSLGL
jgi:hypothetical protein